MTNCKQEILELIIVWEMYVSKLRNVLCMWRKPKTPQLSETTGLRIGRLQDETLQLAVPMIYHSCNTRKATVDAL